MLQEPVLLRAVQGLLGEEETNMKLVLARLDLDQGHENAAFFCMNNIKSGDGPLSNIALDVAKFSSLVKFISKDAGIKTPSTRSSERLP